MIKLDSLILVYLFIPGYFDTRQFKYKPAMIPNVSGITAANTVGNAPPLPKAPAKVITP